MDNTSEKIRINSEDVTNWITDKRFDSIIDVYDWFEKVIASNVIICYYDSYIIDERYPRICFDDIEKFRIWKNDRIEHRKSLESYIEKFKRAEL